MRTGDTKGRVIQVPLTSATRILGQSAPSLQKKSCPVGKSNLDITTDKGCVILSDLLSETIESLDISVH